MSADRHVHPGAAGYIGTSTAMGQVLTLTFLSSLAEIMAGDPSNPVCTLEAEENREAAYKVRNFGIVSAVGMAMGLGMKAGFQGDPGDPARVIAYVELPGHGQVSWHLPAYAGTYDGHSTMQKYLRVAEYLIEMGAEL